MLKILLTGKAIADIKNIYDYIFEDSPQNAEMIKSEILSTVKRLCVFPNMGARLSERLSLKTDYRYFVSKNQYVIFYKEENDTVKIYRVLSSRMDYISILLKIECEKFKQVAIKGCLLFLCIERGNNMENTNIAKNF